MKTLAIVLCIFVLLCVLVVWALFRLAAWADRADDHDEDPS